MVKKNSRFLNEKVLQYFKDSGTSNLTKKHYNVRMTKDFSYGLYKIVLLKNGDLRLCFDVIPTFKDGQPVPNKSGESSHKDQYKIEIQFVKADTYLDFSYPEGDPELSQNLTKVIDNCDLKFYSDDPSFYWQGFWENLDSVNSAIYPFTGTKGKDTWEAIHATSGGLTDSKYRVTKHIAQILIDIGKNYKNKILNKLKLGSYSYE